MLRLELFLCVRLVFSWAIQQPSQQTELRPYRIRIARFRISKLSPLRLAEAAPAQYCHFSELSASLKCSIALYEELDASALRPSPSPAQVQCAFCDSTSGWLYAEPSSACALSPLLPSFPSGPKVRRSKVRRSKVKRSKVKRSKVKRSQIIVATGWSNTWTGHSLSPTRPFAGASTANPYDRSTSPLRGGPPLRSTDPIKIRYFDFNKDLIKNNKLQITNEDFG